MYEMYDYIKLRMRNQIIYDPRNIYCECNFCILIPTTAKLQLYKAAVLPYLTYCSIAWQFCRGSDARKVERVQERGLRAVFCDWNANYKQLLEQANLPTLMNRRLHDIAIIMYKVKLS